MSKNRRVLGSSQLKIDKLRTQYREFYEQTKKRYNERLF